MLTAKSRVIIVPFTFTVVYDLAVRALLQRGYLLDWRELIHSLLPILGFCKTQGLSYDRQGGFDIFGTGDLNAYAALI